MTMNPQHEHQRRLREAQRLAQQRKRAQQQQKRPPVRRPAAVPPRPVNVPIPEPADSLKWNHTAYLVGGGPSLKGFNWSLLTPDKFVVAINRSYEVLPDAQLIYFTDEDFYERHWQAMVAHKGRLIKGCTNVQKKYHNRVEKFYVVAGKGLDMTPGRLFHGRNSTFAALNMLVQWKFKTIYLMGVDMKWGKPGDRTTSHWHDGHKRVDGENTYKSFKSAFVDALSNLKALDVQVININDNSNLNIFPIQSYVEHFGPDAFKSK